MTFNVEMCIDLPGGCNCERSVTTLQVDSGDLLDALNQAIALLEIERKAALDNSLN